jgi:hypothetical protein
MTNHSGNEGLRRGGRRGERVARFSAPPVPGSAAWCVKKAVSPGSRA